MRSFLRQPRLSDAGWRLPRTPEQASWRPLQSQAGSGILTAETLRALRAGSWPKASENPIETGAAFANPRKCRRLGQAGKSAEFTRTKWWRTQSTETGLGKARLQARLRKFPGIREIIREFFK